MTAAIAATVLGVIALAWTGAAYRAIGRMGAELEDESHDLRLTPAERDEYRDGDG